MTISSSRVEVYGARFGITTWYGWALAGGNVIIDHSYVHACCDVNGYAAIFAGDDVPYGGAGEHAKIVLVGCAITLPAGGRVLDVNIDLGNGEFLGCQSVTGLAGIEEITDWEQAAKDVTIESLAAYTLTYNANGGSGVMAGVSGLAGDGVVAVSYTHLDVYKRQFRSNLLYALIYALLSATGAAVAFLLIYAFRGEKNE